jgi:hypothetical protein
MGIPYESLGRAVRLTVTFPAGRRVPVGGRLVVAAGALHSEIQGLFRGPGARGGHRGL